MEFRYRGVDRRPLQPPSFFPPHPPPPPPYFNFFAEERYRGGGFAMTNDVRRNDNYLHTIPSLTPDATHWELEKISLRGTPLEMEARSEMNDFRRHPHYYHANPCITREAAQWELEKISMRRMLLEMEVRTEMMIEREIYLRRMTENAAFGGASSSLVYNSGGTFHKRIGRLVQEGRGFHSGGLTDNLGLECGGSRTLEYKALLEADDRDKVIVMAKPNPSTSGTKRKAVSPPASAISELLKKKPREEWSCAICQVSAANESILKEHLDGKRHKAKEKSLLAHKMVQAKPLTKRKNSGNPSKSCKTKSTYQIDKNSELDMSKDEPNTSGNPNKLCKATGSDHIDKSLQLNTNRDVSKNSGNTSKLFKTSCTTEVGKTLQVNMNKEVSEKNTQIEEEVKQKSGTPVQNMQPKDSENEGMVEAIIKTKKVGQFKYWCEMCQKGSDNETVMNFHNSGKKHQSRLAKLAQNSRIVQALPAILPLPGISQTPNASEVVVEEASEIKEEPVVVMTDAPITHLSLCGKSRAGDEYELNI